jgi:hypothetical protein
MSNVVPIDVGGGTSGLLTNVFARSRSAESRSSAAL